MGKNKVDTGLFSKIQEKCTEREQAHSQRVEMCNELEKMFLMDWVDGKPDIDGKDWIKLTISPDARNKALGAIRLMTAADPKFSVPFEKNDQRGKEQSSLLERAAAAMWLMSGRIRQNPLHYDSVTAAVLFGDIHLGVNSTSDLLEHSKGSSKANMMRFERIASMTPYMFEVYDPRVGFPEYDDYGLSSYYRKVSMKSGMVLDAWGELATKAGMSEDRFEDVDYCDYWDNQYHIVWLEGNSTPIQMAEHNLPCIPIVAQITDGSSIHEKEEHKRQPFLYGLWKSGLWNRQNLSMTVIYSTMFALASNPTFVEKLQSEDRDVRPDFSTPGGKIKLLANEDFYPLIKNAIDPSLTQGMEIAQRAIDESTIYSQTLGEPLGGNAPYSMVALLNQAGRLPLITIQKRAGWAIAKAMELAFTMMRDKGGNNSIRGTDAIVDLAAKDIPENFIMDAKLDIELPQDQKQLIQLAIAGVQSELFSREFARRDFMGIEQSDDMTEDIWAEKLADLELQKEYQKALAKVQMEIQGAQQPQQGAPNMPPQGGQAMPPEMMERGIPSELAEQMQMGGGGATSGLPMTEPMEPLE